VPSTRAMDNGATATRTRLGSTGSSATAVQ
jgi:hypothetical protein